VSTEAILSIGVYGFSEESFFNALKHAGVDCFCDVRARRGLRGSEYAFANAQRLQRHLESLAIRYVHLKKLAPSAAVRDAQRAEDARRGVAKRSRDQLGAAFKAHYRNENLAGFSASALLAGDLQGVRRPVFFCVEREPDACHRSLLTDEISRQTGLPVEHIVP
jgi:uncharacterized protein (DUF488 family)